MRNEPQSKQVSPVGSVAVSRFLAERNGASMYEFALIVSLVAVVSIIVLIALNLNR